MRPDYEPPRPHLVRPLDWSWQEHPEHGRIVHLWSTSNQTWSKQLPWTGIVHEGLERAASFDALVADVAPYLPDRDVQDRRRKVGTYLYMLMVEGYVGMDFPAPPERFAPHLETRRALGRGGVGVAWLCRDTTHHRDVVVKHAWDYFQPLEHADRIMRDEVQILGALDHPGILRLHETFERDGTLHMVREYVDGRPIMLARQDEKGWQRHVAESILQIVRHIHGRGQLILDLRPANFFIRAGDGQVVLVDVGSCVAHQGGEAKVRRGMGTPGFTAPEVRKKGHATLASVLYGYGRLVFQLASGTRPLNDWGQTEMVRALSDHPLAAVVEATTAKEPDRRADLDAVARLVAR